MVAAGNASQNSCMSSSTSLNAYSRSPFLRHAKGGYLMLV